MEVEYCYDNGYLDKALKQAAEFVKRIGESRVLHVIARPDDKVEGAWWVDVVYNKE